MRFIPCHFVTLRTALSRAEAFARLAAVTQPENWSRTPKKGKKFVGHSHGGIFEIRQVSPFGRESGVIVTGQIKEMKSGGSRIELEINPDPLFVFILMLWGMAILFISTLLFIIEWRDHGFNINWLIPYAIVLVIYGVMHAIVEGGASSSVDELRWLWNGEIIKGAKWR